MNQLSCQQFQILSLWDM